MRGGARRACQALEAEAVRKREQKKAGTKRAVINMISEVMVDDEV